MHTKLFIQNTDHHTRAILLKSHHFRSHLKTLSKPLEPTKRTQATYNTKSYADGLQRAFNNAKMQIYFNPDMQYFITLTYKGASHTLEQTLHDVKMLIKAEKRKNHNPKYIFILEYQKRGSIHVHMIANKEFTMHINKNGYNSLTLWKHGFSSVLHIKNFDKNFKPYLYLFKYMRKAQRIGKSFVHSSRNLKNYSELDFTDLDNYPEWTVHHQEYTKSTFNHRGNEYNRSFYRYFLKRDIIPPRNYNSKETKPCVQEQLL